MKLQRSAAQLDGVLVLESDLRHWDDSTRMIFELLHHVFMAYEFRALRLEGIASRNVVMMVVAVDHILDGLVRDLANLLLQEPRAYASKMKLIRLVF